VRGEWGGGGVRKPERIDPLIGRLRKVWHLRPDLRLAQIIACGAPGDPFYCEDEPLMEAIEKTLIGDRE